MPTMTHEVWGTGERVVLVHGSLATGPVEWEGQRPLAAEGYELVVPTRRAYATGAGGEDFLVDGRDVAALLGSGAHLVGHSYGGLAALVAAQLRPEAVRSLVLAEPPAFGIATAQPAVAGLVAELEVVLAADVPDRVFLERFLRAVGTPVAEMPAELLTELTALVPRLRTGRQPWHAPVPVDHLRSAPFPTVVVSGQHDQAFHAVCEVLAELSGRPLRVEPGAGHEVQLAPGFNDLLREVWADGQAR